MPATDTPEPFVLPNWDSPVDSPGNLEPERSSLGPETKVAEARKSTARKRRKRSLAVLTWLLIIVLFGGGGYLVYQGFAQQGQIEVAPVPDHDVSVPADGQLTGDIGDDMVDTNAGPMNVANMQPLHYFVPALKIYSEIVPTSEFDSTRYSDFTGLAIPSDPLKTAWYSAGGALSENEPGTSGTTLLASHVAYNNVWGVLHELYTLKGGEVVYVKDAAGNLSAWKITELTARMHTDFPQEYFSADGDRQLVMVTCGDYDTKTWHYLKNIFAIAVPVDAETLQPFSAESTEQTPSPEPSASRTGASPTS